MFVLGTKLPIAIVGKAVRPQCWDACGDKPPLPYCQQTNAWFDKAVFEWWLKDIFARQVMKIHGADAKVILIVDNFKGHKLEDYVVPKNISTSTSTLLN